MSGRLVALVVVAAAGAGLVSGVFFAFSTFVMDGLGRLPADQGIAAMQSINVTAVTPLFMALLFGTGVACAGLVVSAPFTWDQPAAPLRLAAGLVYLAGVIVMTAAYHVPRNDALALVDPASADAAATWSTYLTTWTAANHVRTLSSLAACVSLILTLRPA